MSQPLSFCLRVYSKLPTIAAQRLSKPYWLSVTPQFQQRGHLVPGACVTSTTKQLLCSTLPGCCSATNFTEETIKNSLKNSSGSCLLYFKKSKKFVNNSCCSYVRGMCNVTAASSECLIKPCSRCNSMAFKTVARIASNISQ